MAFRTSIKPLVFFFSQNYTDEQISQRRTETLSQPMTQSVLSNVKGSGPSPKRVCQNVHILFFYAQSPDFLKPGLCYFLKFLYL